MGKKISFYVVVPKESLDNKESHPPFLTLTCTKNEAFEFILKVLKLEKLNHFELWCNLRELDKDSEEAWKKYLNTVITSEEKRKYVVNKITYQINDVAAIMRMFGGCLPLGCKFDTRSEYEYLKYKLETQKMAEHISETLNKVKEEAEQSLKEEEKTNGAQ